MRAQLANFVWTLLLIAAGLAALGAAAAQGGRFSPALDLLAQFAPLYGSVGLGVLGATLYVHRRRRRPLLILSLVAMAGSAALIVPEFARSAGPTAPAGAPREIKIIQFNTLRLNDQIGPIVEWLVAQRPDIVTTQETRHDLRDAIVARTGWQVAGAAGDLMIFSARPRIRMTRPSMPKGAAHWVNATYPSASGPYEVVTVHLDWPIGASQRRQWASLASVIAHLPHDRMILTGDFNATPWGFTLRQGEQAIPLTRRERAVPTFPARWNADGPIRSPLALLPIDHVYAGPGWRTVKVERGPALGSDHYPLIVTLAPVSPAPPAPR